MCKKQRQELKLGFGILQIQNSFKKDCLQILSLVSNGYAELANPEHSLRPSAGGSPYLFEDNVILFHRKDSGAPTHKLYHSIPGGFPRSQKELYSAEGLRQIGLRESAEENLLITRDTKPKLIVPKDSVDHVLKSAKRLGIDHLPKNRSGDRGFRAFRCFGSLW